MSAIEKWIDQIHTGDSGELLLKMPAECVDLVVTSPPYDDLTTPRSPSLELLKKC